MAILGFGMSFAVQGSRMVPGFTTKGLQTVSGPFPFSTNFGETDGEMRKADGEEGDGWGDTACGPCMLWVPYRTVTI